MADDKSKLILCPYCGNTQSEPEDRCAACGGFFDNLSLKVTQQHMGPWFVRDRHNPFRPGCSYEVLKKQIERGKVRPTTILRGPTTRQFWSVARNVPGVAHLLGFCHGCGGRVDPDAEQCPQCQTRFFSPQLRDKLGLAPAGAEMPSHGALTGTGEDQRGGLKFPADQAAAPDNGDAGRAPNQSPAGMPGATAGGTRQSGGSPILAGLRMDEPGQAEAANQASGSAATVARDPEAVTQATTQAKRARAAMAWMTADAEAEPDTLATAAEPTSALQQRSTNWWTWLLIAINAGLFAVVIAAAVIIINNTQSDGAERAGVGGGQIVQPGGDPIQRPGERDDASADPETVVAPGGDDAAEPPNPIGGQGEGEGEGTGELTGAGEAGGEPLGGGDGQTPDIFGDAGPAGESEMAANRWAQRYEEAMEMEARGNLSEALKLLKRIRTDAPEQARPEGLNEAIDRINAELDRRAAEILG